MTRQLSNADLADLDAGELREHAAEYVAEHGWADGYAGTLCHRCWLALELDPQFSLSSIAADIEADAAAISAGAPR